MDMSLFITLVILLRYVFTAFSSSHPFLFSVIIPFYQTGRFLPQSIDSVLSQSIGFKSNIQLILVNDGSTDDGESICIEYQKQYPDNIIYIKQMHAGVSAARNNGLKYALGKYINFLDSDDYWSTDAFLVAYTFFQKHYSEIDIASARMQFFEARTHFHPLDYKFRSTRVVDLRNHFDHVQLSGASCFFKASAISNLSFSPTLQYGEDCLFINTLLLQKCKLGVLREAVYMARKRLDSSSALQTQLLSRSFYLDSPTLFHRNLFELSRQQYGKILPFIQYTSLIDLHGRIFSPPPNDQTLSRNEASQYKNTIIDLLQEIDDYIILHARGIQMRRKIFCLSKKYGRDLRRQFHIDPNGLILLNKTTVMTETEYLSCIYIAVLTIQNKHLILEGIDYCWLYPNDYSFYAKIADTIIKPTYLDSSQRHIPTLFGELELNRYIKFNISLECCSTTTVTFHFQFHQYDRLAIIKHGRFTYIPMSKNGYYLIDGLLLRKDQSTITSVPYTWTKHKQYERLYSHELFRLQKYQLVLYRRLAFLLKPKKQIWLLMDRTSQAGDNAEEMFKYLQQVGDKNITAIFCVKKSSPDYYRLKQYGHVVAYGGFFHKLIFLLSDYLLSSQADDMIFNAFDSDREFMSDLYRFQFIYLQHGAVKDDISNYLHHLNTNLQLLVSVGRPELEEFRNHRYGHSPSVPILLGFPRHDLLYRLQSEKYQANSSGSYMETSILSS